MADIQNYVFIDGNYLRRAYEDTMRKFFEHVHHTNIDLKALKHFAGASKAFYYAAIDETARGSTCRRATRSSAASANARSFARPGS